MFTMNKTSFYEAPSVEVVELKMEGTILDESTTENANPISGTWGS